METPFEVALRLQDRLMAVLSMECGSRQLAEEAWSDVVLERIHRVCELYDESKGSLDGYVVMTMRLYARKWRRRSLRFIGEKTRLARSSSPLSTHHSTVDKTDLSEELLARLDVYDAWILRAHVLEGYTFKEIASVANLSKSMMRIHYERALRGAWLALRKVIDDDP